MKQYLLQVVYLGRIYYIDINETLTRKKGDAQMMNADKANRLKTQIMNNTLADKGATDCQLLFISGIKR